MNYYYSDVFDEIKNGDIVLIPNHFGNIRTYFLDKNKKSVQMFNKCKPSFFTKHKTVIDKIDLSNLIVLEKNSVEYNTYLNKNTYLKNLIL